MDFWTGYLAGVSSLLLLALVAHLFWKWLEGDFDEETD